MIRRFGFLPTAMPSCIVPLLAALVTAFTVGRADGLTINVPADFPTIQAAVVAAAPNDVIQVAAGVYVEQVTVVGKPLTIRGAGVGATIIQSPAGTLAASFSTPTPHRCVVSAVGGDLVIEDLTIDGLGNGNANLPRFIGLGFRNAGGRATNVRVTGVRNTPLDGSFVHIGVWASNNTGGPYLLELGSVVVDDFQASGMVLASSGLNLDIHDCRVTGIGPNLLQPQNGMQIGTSTVAAVNGTIARTRVEDLWWTDPGDFAVGIYFIGTGTFTVSDLAGANAFATVEGPIVSSNTNLNLDGLEVDVTSAEQFAVQITNLSASKVIPRGGDASVGGPGSHVWIEDEEAAGSNAGGKLPTTNAAMNCSVTNACMTGAFRTGSRAVWASSVGGPLTVNVTNSTFSGWEVALEPNVPSVTMNANRCAFVGNGAGAYINTLSLAAQDLRYNWWGDASGPSGDGPGSGESILGTNTTYSPWLTSGTDTNPGLCGFQPPPTAVTPISPGICLSSSNWCLTVPIQISRNDSAPLRGYSVTFRLSPELYLCSGPSFSIPAGPYLGTGAGVNGTQRFIRDNFDGSYTVDEAILGSPCGATAASGILFSVEVASFYFEATGTVTVTDVRLRDCDNVPIEAEAGAPVVIEIDQSVPTPIFAPNLTASQQTTGNDADGTTKVTVSWPPTDPDVTISIYRKGFGFYPEYDDAGGAAPTTIPSYPADAIAQGWTLAGTVAPPATSFVDEVAGPRDFYYYVVYLNDACGNVGNAATRTLGTLNYHLGDVSDGFTAGQGDNLVSTPDISLLGASYGLSGAAVTPVNYLDVGPTTGVFVTARPSTDNRIDFEDLILFAINFGEVSAPDVLAEGSGPLADRDRLSLEVEGAVAPGHELTARVALSGSGRLQGLSVPLTWNPRVVEPVDFAEGDLVRRQNGIALSPSPGTVDVALLGARTQGFAGTGELLSVRFRVIGAGDPEIGIGTVIARDPANQPVDLAAPSIAIDARPSATMLLPASPNPAPGATRIGFTLARGTTVDLAIYTVAGRRVKGLASGAYEAGVHGAAWDATDESGRRMGPGVYYAGFETADGARQSRTLILIGR